MKYSPTLIYTVNIALMIFYQVYWGAVGKNEAGGIVGCAAAMLIHFLLNFAMASLSENLQISRAYGFSMILILLIGVPSCVILPSKL